MTCSRLRRKRIAARLSLAPVALALGRTPGWLSLVERGHIRISSSTAFRIREVIARQHSLDKAIRAAFRFGDLKLTRARNRGLRASRHNRSRRLR